MKQHYPLDPVTGIENPALAWANGNPATGTNGSYPPYGLFLDPQAEILAAQRAGGLTDTADGSDTAQLSQAISRGTWLGLLGQAATVNDLTAALPGSILWPQLLIGMEFSGTVNAANTGPMTIALAGFGTSPGKLNLITRSGNPLAAGDLPANLPFRFRYDGSAFRLTGIATSDIGAVAPIFPPANATFYVRPDGSDANDGSANTAAKAFGTIGGAIAAIAKRYALTGVAVTLQLGVAASYALPTTMPAFNGTIILQGDTSNPLNYPLTGAGPAGSGSGVISIYSGTLQLSGVTVNNTGTTNNTLNAQSNGSIVCTYVAFTGTASGWAHGLAANGGSLTIGTGCQIRSNASAAFLADGGNIAIQSGSAITIVNTPAFSVGFAVATNAGVLKTGGSVTFPGSGATGPRYSVTYNGVVSSGGGGANFYPGSTAGSTSTGGQYA